MSFALVIVVSPNRRSQVYVTVSETRPQNRQKSTEEGWQGERKLKHKVKEKGGKSMRQREKRKKDSKREK